MSLAYLAEVLPNLVTTKAVCFFSHVMVFQ